jgi:hypothetical protein
MILKRDEVEAGHVGEPGKLDHSLPLVGYGGDEDAEFEVLAVVGHSRKASDA